MPLARGRYRFEQYFATRRTLGFAVAPNGEQVLFVGDISGQYNLWRVPSAGGWPEQLTLFSQESVRQAAYARDGSRIAFIADPDGNEQYQVYLMDAVGGWPEKITYVPDAQHAIEGGSFSPDGKWLAYSANARDRSEVDVYLYHLETGAVRTAASGGRLYFGSFAPGGSQIVVTEVMGNTDQNLLLVDLETGEKRNLTPHEGSVIHFPGPWQPDGSGFYFYTNAGREFTGLAFYDLAAGQWRYVLTPDWDVESASLSARHNLLAYVVNESGNSTVRVLDLGTGRELDLPAIPPGVIAGCSFGRQDARRRLFLQVGNYRQAGAIYVLDLDQGEFRAVTHSMLGNIPPEEFVAPELVHIRSFDRLSVPAWLYRPAGLVPGERVPALLSIHGGPEAQERPEYRYTGFYQYLLSRGIAILAPNIRGSTGYGISYQKLVHRDWAGADLQDLEACAQYLRSLDWVDARRLGVWGGSYGGFATLSCITRLPEYWAVGCELVGPSNLVTFVRSVPPHWRPMMKQWVGDPDEDRDFLMQRSPITYVDNIRCPLMVVQGANDPRVVQAESDQMVERMRANGLEVEYLVFDDEGHGFAKRTNQLRGFKAMADFLIRHLVGN